MKRFLNIVFSLCLLAAPAFADIDSAKRLMEEGRFEEAREALDIAAQSGNADAEVMIATMYSLGLGVEQDHVRAFDWFMRAAMKGHAAAQSDVGWHFEAGIGLPAPDPLRAFVWYQLSGIGGDPDAPKFLREAIKKLTEEEINHGLKLVDDYRVWMFPFR